MSSFRIWHPAPPSGSGSAAPHFAAQHPRLIVCDISGYTAGTPHYDRKAYDLLVQAEVGLAYVTGSEASGPSRVGVSICDIATGQAAYAAILEALLGRARSGQGCHIQLSLFDTIADYMNVPYLTRRYGGREPARLGLAHPSIAPYGVFHLRDGDIVLAIQSEREWQVLCAEVLADQAFAGDPRFDLNLRRVQNRQALDAHIQEILGRRSLAEVSATLDRHRIAYGLVSTMGDLMAHGSATTLPVATPAGEVELLAPPAIVDGKRAALRPVPSLGQARLGLAGRIRHGAAGRAEALMQPGEMAELRAWIGRRSEAEDIVTERLVEGFRSTLASHLPPSREGEAPLGIHWCLAPAMTPISELGPDGHPVKGILLPPVPLPRRMWAGGEIEGSPVLRIGDRVLRRSVISDVVAKDGTLGAPLLRDGRA